MLRNLRSRGPCDARLHDVSFADLDKRGVAGASAGQSREASATAASAPLNGYNTAVNVLIVIIMALIGLLFFMGLLRESTLLRLAAAGGGFWLIIMFVLTFSDYFTR